MSDNETLECPELQKAFEGYVVLFYPGVTLHPNVKAQLFRAFVAGASIYQGCATEAMSEKRSGDAGLATQRLQRMADEAEEFAVRCVAPDPGQGHDT